MKWLKTYSWLIVLFLWSPLLLVLWKGCSISAFQALLDNTELLHSLYQSVLLASSTCIITTILGTLTAFAIPHLGTFGKKIVESSIILPLILPEIAFGLAYLVWYERIGLHLGWSTLILSHVAFTFCYSTMVMRPSVEAIDWSLLDAAHDLGANRWRSFRHAVLPQLLPGMMASVMMAFSVSLDDFLISFFVKGIDQVTLPIKIFSMMRFRVGPEIYALSIVLFCISLISVLITQLWITKSAKT